MEQHRPQTQRVIDVGVLGLTARARADSDALKTFANPQTEAIAFPGDQPNLAKEIWGSESEETIARKHATWQSLREIQMKQKQKKAGFQDVAKIIIALYVFQKASHYFGFKARKLGSVLALSGMVLLLYKNRAPSPRWIPDALQVTHRTFPILGQIGVIRDVLVNGQVPTQVSTVTAHGFQSHEVLIFGGRRDVGIMDPRDREYFLKTNWKNYVKNGDDGAGFQELFAEVMGRGIFAVDGDEWQDHRKVASHLFSASALKSKMEASFTKHGRILVDLVGKKADAGEVFDAQDAMANLTFETICDIAFDSNPGSLEAGFRGKKIDFLVQFDRIQQNSIMRFILPKPIWTFLSYFDLGFERQIRIDGDNLRSYVRNIIQKRRAEGDFENKDDLLAMYVRTARSTGKKYMEEDDYLIDCVLNFVIAGRDTTSCTLTNMIKFVDETVQEKMLAEFDSVVGRGNHVTWDHMRDLRYFGAVFNEVLRMMPPVGGDLRTAVHDDVMPSGIRIEAGQRVSIMNCAIGRDPNLWTEPNSFMPERWLQEGRPTRRPDEFMFPVFWGGPRACLGRDMARAEVASIGKALLENFRFVKLPCSDRTVNGPVIFYEQGLPVRAVRR